MLTKLRKQFPAGTPVRVKQGTMTGAGTYVTSELFGVILEWTVEPTGAWYASNGDPSVLNADGKVQLRRLKLKKVDGEISDVVIDSLTRIAKLEVK